MTVTLVVLGAVLATVAGLRGLRPASGAGDRALRVVGGGGLLALAVAALAGGSPAGAAIAAAAGLPLLLGSTLPWLLSRAGPVIAGVRGRLGRGGAPTASR
jgi:hypothetical protein